MYACMILSSEGLGSAEPLYLFSPAYLQESAEEAGFSRLKIRKATETADTFMSSNQPYFQNQTLERSSINLGREVQSCFFDAGRSFYTGSGCWRVRNAY